MENSDNKQFLLGRGERLAEPVSYKSGFGDSKPPYNLDRQRERLKPKLRKQSKLMRLLSDDSCPEDQIVSQFLLHPQYISRSSFPESLLREFDLRLVGSRPTIIKPETGRGSDNEAGVNSTILFIAGKRSAFEAFENSLDNLTEIDSVSEDLLKLESIDLLEAKDRIFGEISDNNISLELIVHFDSNFDGEWEDNFHDYSIKSGVKLDFKKNYQTRGLLFIPAVGDIRSVENLANFSFIRAIRPIPKLRIIEKPNILRSLSATHNYLLPSEGSIDPNCKIAIFDGGLVTDHPFGNWVNEIEPPSKYSIGAPVADFQEHGTAVTSASLFGHIESESQPRPYSNIDHYRVLGDEVTDIKLYDVMLYVDEILSQTNYPLLSFSIGPYEVAGDDVTAWTSMLDDHLGEGYSLATIAVGNDGHLPWPKSRIQVPSDCVNALAIGASDSASEGWKRAPYSSIGPGRHPGIIKPDLVHFGGVSDNQFKFIFPNNTIAEGSGTSYATPAAIRHAAGLKAYYGSDLTAQAIRALMVHSANSGGNNLIDVGWGLINSDIEEVVTCGEGEVRIVYQGKLDPSKILRTPIPIPDEQLNGNVLIRATFCYGCKTDPHTPGEYTRAGLNIVFRPHKLKFKKDKDYPNTDSFFTKKQKNTEQELRNSHKWDTVLHNEVTKRGASLYEPVFDIHYLAREPGVKSSPSKAPKLPYALIVTVVNKNTPDLYTKVENKYRNRLTAMTPRVDIKIPVIT